MNNNHYNQQVKKEHYSFGDYYDEKRWISIWNQINEILLLKPMNVLEIGGGLALTKSIVKKFGIIDYTIVDYAKDLSPDILASVTNLPLTENSYDLVCAFQVLEHLKIEDFRTAVIEICRVAKSNVLISLPNAEVLYPQCISLPKIGTLKISIRRPFVKYMPLSEDSDHKWELGRGLSSKEVVNAFADNGFVCFKQYRVHGNPYHHFFVFESV